MSKSSSTSVPVAVPILVFAAAAAAAGCHAPPPPPFPRYAAPPPTPELVLVWVGTGEAERIADDGTWRRTPAYDYEFSVEQRRYRDHWESIKSIRWRHPQYDGAAGPREQTWFFQLGLTPAADHVVAAVHSSLGDGAGTTDREFRAATMTMRANVSRFAPFDTYRITQRYGYEAGTLDETVELFDHDGAVEEPWVRNHEHARLFASQAFPAAPTTL